MFHLATRDKNSRSSWVVVVTSSGGRWYGCARGKGEITPKRGWPRRIGGRRFSLSRSIWPVLGGRRLKMYYQLHHGRILWFHGFAILRDFCGLNANEHQRKKNGEKQGIFGTRDTDLRKAVFQAIWIVVAGFRQAKLRTEREKRHIKRPNLKLLEICDSLIFLLVCLPGVKSWSSTAGEWEKDARVSECRWKANGESRHGSFALTFYSERISEIIAKLSQNTIIT